MLLHCIREVLCRILPSCVRLSVYRKPTNGRQKTLCFEDLWFVFILSCYKFNKSKKTPRQVSAKSVNSKSSKALRVSTRSIYSVMAMG